MADPYLLQLGLQFTIVLLDRNYISQSSMATASQLLQLVADPTPWPPVQVRYTAGAYSDASEMWLFADRTVLFSAGNDAEVEVAVFRFTLGIPGFEDTYIPRVIGSLGILVLIANHVLGSTVVSDTQVVVLHFVMYAASGVALCALHKVAPTLCRYAQNCLQQFLQQSALSVLQLRPG